MKKILFIAATLFVSFISNAQSNKIIGTWVYKDTAMNVQIKIQRDGYFITSVPQFGVKADTSTYQLKNDSTLEITRIKKGKTKLKEKQFKLTDDNTLVFYDPKLHKWQDVAYKRQ